MLTEIQNRLRAIVMEEPLLANRPVLVEDKGNLVSDLEVALETQSLAVVVALSSGEQKESIPRPRAAWDENFEVVIHRGLLDGTDVPSTVAVLEALRKRIQGALLDPAKPHASAFRCTRHDLRENGEGAYARVLSVSAPATS